MIELAFLIGLLWACSRGWDTARTAVRSRTAAARKKTPDPHKRRAARQAWAGWWLGEALHLFPTTRHGLAAGWENHRQAWRETQLATTQRRADHAWSWAEIRAEIAAHARRLEIAAQRADGQPPMSEQLRAAMKRRIAQLAGERDAAQAPPWRATEQAAAAWRAAEAGGGGRAPGPGIQPYACCGRYFVHAATCTKPGQLTPVPGPAANGTPSGGTVPGETNYTEVLGLCDKAITAAEHAASEADLGPVTQLVDSLGTMLRDDAETMGRAAELSAAAAAVTASLRQLQEAAAAMKTRTEQAYQAHQDARDSTGHAPEPEFTEA
jgi:hypothetical protein